MTYVPYSMGRMEYNWGPDAASFNPERWLKEGYFQNASPFKFTAFQVSLNDEAVNIVRPQLNLDYASFPNLHCRSQLKMQI